MFLDSFGNIYNDGFASYDNPIKSFIESRKITKLVHFTNGKNAKSIKKYGILSVAELQKRGWFYSKNDEMRLDGLLDFISLSITDINHFVFDKFVNNGSLKDPHIVIISPRILWESNNKRLYCIANAATKSARGGALKDLKALFDDVIEYNVGGNIRTVNRRARDLNQPTDPQAEILFQRIVEPKYIIKCCPYERKYFCEDDDILF